MTLLDVERLGRENDRLRLRLLARCEEVNDLRDDLARSESARRRLASQLVEAGQWGQELRRTVMQLRMADMLPGVDADCVGADDLERVH